MPNDPQELALDSKPAGQVTTIYVRTCVTSPYLVPLNESNAGQTIYGVTVFSFHVFSLLYWMNKKHNLPATLRTLETFVIILKVDAYLNIIFPLTM